MFYREPKLGDRVGCVMFGFPEEPATIVAINNKNGDILICFDAWMNYWKGPFSQLNIDNIKKWLPEVSYDMDLMNCSIGKTTQWIYNTSYKEDSKTFIIKHFKKQEFKPIPCSRICAKCGQFDKYAAPSNKHNGEVRCYKCF